MFPESYPYSKRSPRTYLHRRLVSRTLPSAFASPWGYLFPSIHVLALSIFMSSFKCHRLVRPSLITIFWIVSPFPLPDIFFIIFIFFWLQIFEQHGVPFHQYMIPVHHWWKFNNCWWLSMLHLPKVVRYSLLAVGDLAPEFHPRWLSWVVPGNECHRSVSLEADSEINMSILKI